MQGAAKKKRETEKLRLITKLFGYTQTSRRLYFYCALLFNASRVIEQKTNIHYEGRGTPRETGKSCGATKSPLTFCFGVLVLILRLGHGLIDMGLTRPMPLQ